MAASPSAPSLGNFLRLEELLISSSDSLKIPLEIKCLVELRRLTLRSSQIELPTSIGGFPHLKEIRIERAIELPGEIGALSRLKTLHIHSPGLKKLPDSMGELSNLEELSLDCRHLTELPHKLWRLKGLKKLVIESPLIELTAASTQGLPQLRSLHLMQGPKIDLSGLKEGVEVEWM